MPDLAVPTAPALSSVRRVELAHTGRWAISSGSWQPSRDDFVAAMAALDCPAVRRPVLKIGHSQGETPLWAGNPTGAPAAGWVDNMATTNQGHTLVGDFVGMPGWLGDIAASAYPDRSVEGKYDHRCQIGHTHPFVITAVSLLGVTPPGVGTLKSLQDVGRLYGVEATVTPEPDVVAHLRGQHDQDSHGRGGPGALGSILSTVLDTAAGPISIDAREDGLHLSYGTSKSGALDRKAAQKLADLLEFGPSDDSDDDPSAYDRPPQSVATYDGDGPPTGFAQVSNRGGVTELELLSDDNTHQLTRPEAQRLAAVVGQYAVANRFDTADGPVDALLDGKNIGLRVPADGGGREEVRFSVRDWARVNNAINLVAEGFDELGQVTSPDVDLDALRVKTDVGPLLVTRDGDPDANPTLTVRPVDGGWTLSTTSRGLYDALAWVEEAAGVDEFSDAASTRRGITLAEVAAAEVVAHLPGKHDQSTHGKKKAPSLPDVGGVSSPSRSRPSSRSRSTSAEDTPTKQAPAKKAPAKKTTAKKQTPAKRTAAKKAPAKAAPRKRTPTTSPDQAATINRLTALDQNLRRVPIATRGARGRKSLSREVRDLRTGVDTGDVSPAEAAARLAELGERPDVAGDSRLEDLVFRAVNDLRGDGPDTPAAPEPDRGREAPETPETTEVPESPIPDPEPAPARPEAPTAPSPVRQPPTPQQADEAVTDAVVELLRPGNDYITLADLRDRLTDLTRQEQDDALRRLARPDSDNNRLYTLTSEANQKILTPRDRAARIEHGNQPKDLLAVDRDVLRQRRPDAGRARPAPRQAPEPATPAAPEPDSTPEPPPAPAAPSRPSGGPIEPGSVSRAPIVENRWGQVGDPSYPVHYHDDGSIGTAVKNMGDDAQLDVDGQPLANVLGRLATDAVMGRTSTQESLDSIKTLRDRLPEGSTARRELDLAIDRMDAPDTPVPALPDATPAPLRQLMTDLHAVPVARREPALEEAPLRELLDQWAAGRTGGTRMVEAVRQLQNRRHESTEGKAEIDRVVGQAVADLEAMLRDNRRALNPPTQASVQVQAHLAGEHNQQSHGGDGVDFDLPEVSIATAAGELQLVADDTGDVDLTVGDSGTTLSADETQELADGLDDLLDTAIADDADSADVVQAVELRSEIELALYGDGSVRISWDGDTERIEIDLEPEDVAPVRDALQQVVDDVNDTVLASARPEVEQVQAAADVRTGAMVALLPSEEDVQRLAVDGGEAAGQLHVTLLFLGEAAAYDQAARDAIVDAIRALAEVIPPGQVNGFATSIFNPGDPSKDTAVVLELGGDGLDDVHGMAESAVEEVTAEHGLMIPDQHTPWRPHVTLVYSDDLTNVVRLTDRVGPVSLDRIRVAFAGENTDIPLTGEGNDDPDLDEVTDDDMPVMASGEVTAQESRRITRSDRPLRNYWLRGKGSLKIRWGTGGDWTRCVRQLRRHVRDPKGLCSVYHKEATGVWPGSRFNVGRRAASAPAAEAITLPSDALGPPAGLTGHEYSEVQMPNPNPTIIHAAAHVSVDNVREAYYRQAPQQAWIREFHTSPQQLIVANDSDGSVARVDFEVGDDGQIRFSEPKRVRVAYVEDADDAEREKVEASRMVYASAAESRPSLVTARQVQAAMVSDKPWADFTQADYAPEQWRRATLLDRGPDAGDEDDKQRYGLPVREPDGTLNRNAVHAAAGGHGIGAVEGISDELRQSTARKIVRLYRDELNEDPPESLLSLADMSTEASALDPQPEPPAAEPDHPTTEEDDMSLTEVRQRLGLADDADETAVLAALDELKTKADTAPDPKQVAAAAAEKDELTKEVGLLKGQVEAMSAKIADGEAQAAAKVKASVLDTAQTEGKFTPEQREQWEQDYDAAPNAVTRVLASIAVGTAVPVNPQGKVGDPQAATAADDEDETQFAEWDRLFSTPALAGKES